MPAPVASSLRSYRRQNLLTEFASLKHVQPEGIYVSLTPGDPSLWSGVLFVREGKPRAFLCMCSRRTHTQLYLYGQWPLVHVSRIHLFRDSGEWRFFYHVLDSPLTCACWVGKGPYAPAILRFRIYFPPAYPHIAPLVTFNADIFHPLLFDATRSSQNTGSAFDHVPERPPPGALNLRHGFSCWQKRTSDSPSSGSPTRPTPQADPTLPQNKTDSSVDSDSHLNDSPDADNIYVVDILRYMRAAFEDVALLDRLPFEEAANQSAWYAWRASKHSAHFKAPATPSTAQPASAESDVPPVVNQNPPSTPAKAVRTAASTMAGTNTPKATPKKPSEWKWEGVWEMRVRKGIEASVTDASLFGASGLRDDEIHFVSVGPEEVDGMRAELHAHLREA